MPTAAELLSSSPPKVLMYGPPGTSKTISAMTLGNRAEMLDCDRGFSSGVTFKDRWTEDRKQVEVTLCLDDGPMTANGFEKAKNRILQIHNAIVQKTYNKEVVILDSVTTLCESCMKGTLITAQRWANSKKIEIQDYGVAVNYVQQVFNILRGLPIPVIVIAHDYTKEATKENLNPKTQVVTVGNKLASIMPAFFDEVWYMKITGANSQQNYCFQTKSTPTVMARSRRNLPDFTNSNLGMVEIFKQLGWEFRKDEVK